MEERAEPLNTLLVEDNPTDALLVRTTLESTPGFRIREAGTLADCRRLLAQARLDVVLLDLNLPDSQGIRTLEQVCAEWPDIPVLVFTGLNDHATKLAALRAGAQDYLDKGQLQTVLLGRVIRYAVERFAWVRASEAEQRRKEMRSVEKLAVPAETAVTARIYSDGRVSEAYPAEFEANTALYADLLERAMRHRLYKTAPGISDQLRALAAEIGGRRGSPRDVIELHTTAMKQLVDASASRVRAQAFLEEGRLMVLELMGHLAAYYRVRFPAPVERAAGAAAASAASGEPAALPSKGDQS